MGRLVCDHPCDWFYRSTLGLGARLRIRRGRLDPWGWLAMQIQDLDGTFAITDQEEQTAGGVENLPDAPSCQSGCA